MTARSMFTRAAIVVLLLAVFLCLSLSAVGAMDDGMGHVVLLCCFGLAFGLAVRALRRPSGIALAGSRTPPRAIRPVLLGIPAPRAPDSIDLGVLLI